MVGSRIDQVYVAPEWVANVPDIASMHCPYSDHEGVTGVIWWPQEMAAGAGFWQLNTALLVKDSTVQRFRGQWDKHLARGQDPEEKWRQFKSWAQAFFVEEREYIQWVWCKDQRCLKAQLQQITTKISHSHEVLEEN